MRAYGLCAAGPIVMWLMVAAGHPTHLQETQKTDPASWSREEKKQFLLTAKIIRLRDAGDGITLSQRATLQNEAGTHDAHIQTIDEFKPKYETPMGVEINFKDTYKFNLAAYLLDRMMDLNLIPVTVERKVQAKSAAATWWIDDILTNERDRYKQNIKPPDPEIWNRAMYIVRVFDQLIANVDRNLGNIIITRNWDLWMIDHTRAFRKSDRLQNAKNLVSCDRELLKALRQLDKTTLKAELGKYLDGMEIDGLLARRDRIVKFFDDKIAKEGEGAVLYDYLSERRKTSR